MGGINLIAILVIGALSHGEEHEKKKEEHSDLEKKPVHQVQQQEYKVVAHEPFRPAVKERKKKSKSSKIFFTIFGLGIGIGALFTAYNYLNDQSDSITIPSDGYVYTETGTVLGTGEQNTTGAQQTASDIFSGLNASGEAITQETTGTVL